jgi:phage/plasmid-like protein (TIGR03299 family)
METSKTNFADQILSNIFSDESLINEMLDTYGLNWKVSKLPLLLPNQKETGFFGIVRDDTQTTFSTCKDGYEPFQNYQLGELLLRVCEKTGYELHSGGKFNDGGKVYLQLKTGNTIEGLGKNGTTVEGFVTGINSHDGTTSLKWGAVNFTICCRNTFAYAQKELKNSARHTQSIHAKVEQSIMSINGIIEQEKSLFEKFITLSEISVKKANIGMIVNQVTGVDMNLGIAEAKEKYSGYALNRSQELLGSISTEMKSKGQTLWGLFSGVTHYTTHKMPISKKENARIESKYTGSALGIDNKALSSILELV